MADRDQLKNDRLTLVSMESSGKPPGDPVQLAALAEPDVHVCCLNGAED